MMEVQGSDVTYTCISSQHESTGEPEGIHMSQNMVDAFRALGANVDILLEFLKRPWLTIIAGIAPKSW